MLHSILLARSSSLSPSAPQHPFVATFVTAWLCELCQRLELRMRGTRMVGKREEESRKNRDRESKKQDTQRQHLVRGSGFQVLMINHGTQACFMGLYPTLPLAQACYDCLRADSELLEYVNLHGNARRIPVWLRCLHTDARLSSGKFIIRQD